MLRLDGISLARSGRTIFGGISAEIPEGAFIGLLGPNGAGKTRLLRLIAGLESPTTGRLAWRGRPGSPWRRWWKPLWGARIGFVPQLPPAVVFPLSVNDIFDSLSIDPGRGLEWLERLGLPDVGQRCFHTLSGGEKRRVLLALTLTQSPELLLLDEADSFLDREGRALAGRIVAEWWKVGGGSRTVLTASHHPEEFPDGLTHLWHLGGGTLRPVQADQPC
ncbi:MAG TPA: ATP-binding cassette domain-containing protein [Candidatus Ozemobacteraceae bacterium]|nr:ATP-binding cassette domain-containing protein [Candidatus Ozemobacteraceae bacterium]